MKNNSVEAKRLATLGMLSAMGVVGRIMFGLPFLPNIQPMTVIILLVAYETELYESLTLGTISIVVTSMYLGMGPWVITQIFAYWVLIVVSHLISKLNMKNPRILLLLWAVMSGFIYGAIITYFDYLLYGIPNLLVYYINGLPFDFLHAMGNLGFFIVLYPLYVKLKNKGK